VAIRVLIVDDHPTFRRFATRLLERDGFEIVGQAGDCHGARLEARRLEPDAILLDVLLPDGSGIELAAELAGLESRPTVVLTSSRAPEDLRPSIDGARFVPKDALSGRTFAAAVLA
jgi:DNA-binding NarL/FixJ family response regulator